jgi:hypothetical protein
VKEVDTGGTLGSTNFFTMGARNMNAGTEVDCDQCDTGVGAYPSEALCGTTIGSSTVECYGDITQSCSDYSVATYMGRSCRTICESSGDKPYCSNSSPVYVSLSLSQVLICDVVISS